MKSCAPTVCAARTISSAVASGRPKAMFSATVPAKRNPSCGTTPSWRRSDECDRRSRRHVEIDAVQYLVAAAVREPHALEADPALDLCELPRARPVDHLGLLVEHAHDLVERSCRRQERVVELRELL